MGRESGAAESAAGFETFVRVGGVAGLLVAVLSVVINEVLLLAPPDPPVRGADGGAVTSVP